MTKKIVSAFVSGTCCCFDIMQQQNGELSSDYFTVTPQVLEAVGGKVPATINGKFPEKYFKKKSCSGSYSGFEMGKAAKLKVSLPYSRVKK